MNKIYQTKEEQEFVRFVLKKMEQEQISVAEICSKCNISQARFSLLKNNKAALKLQDVFEILEFFGFEFHMKEKMKNTQ